MVSAPISRPASRVNRNKGLDQGPLFSREVGRIRPCSHPAVLTKTIPYRTDSKMRKTLCCVGLALMLISLGLIYVYEHRARSTHFYFPNVSEVDEIRVTIDPDENSGLSSYPEFVIPDKYVEAIFALFTPAMPDQTRNHKNQLAYTSSAKGVKTHVIVTMTLELKNGRSIFVRVYYMGQNPLHYSIDGEDYFRGGPYCPIGVSSREHSEGAVLDEGMSLYYLMVEMFLETKSGIERPQIAQLLADSARSRGDIPPIDKQR